MRLAPTLLAVISAFAPVAIAPAPAVAQPTTTPVTVARYTFDRGLAAGGTIADVSGRGLPLRVRAANAGAVRFLAHGAGRAVVFPARCAAATCARAILEAGDDADLDPGTRPFRYGASVRATAAQIGTGANIMQKGVASTRSQWKLQIGARGRAQCVLVGQGSTRIYLARSSTPVTDGAWHQILCRRAGGTLSVYVDGTARGSVAVPAAVSIGNALPLRLGGRGLNARTDQYGGALDDVHAILG